MYGYIKGIVKEIESNYIVIDNHDIGYIIYVPNPYYYQINNSYTVYTYTHIREDEYSLYGFANQEALKLFLKLISVKGLGPKMALPMLATGSPDGIIDAIDRENILYLKKFPKIGDKVARQIILDLKGKLNGNQISLLDVKNDELTDALVALGYKQADIKKVIKNINTSLPIEEQIKEAFKLLLKWGDHMKIGIDIDDTITDTWKTLIPIYSKVFNKDLNLLSKSAPYYQSIKDLNITVDEYFNIMKPYYKDNILNVPLKPYAKETINKLYDDGYTIIFITARGKMYDNPYEITKEYLDTSGIKYHKLITGAEKKEEVCIKENISIFIDDSFKHCSAVATSGIKVLMPSTIYNKKYLEFPHFTSWQEVPTYIKNIELETGE